MEAPNSTQNFLNADIHNDEIDLGKLFRFLMMQSKLILSIVFVVFTIFWYNNSSQSFRLIITVSSVFFSLYDLTVQ